MPNFVHALGKILQDLTETQGVVMALKESETMYVFWMCCPAGGT